MIAAVQKWAGVRLSLLIAGVIVWGVVAVAAAFHARSAGMAPLETIVTWDEWIAAALLFPWLGGVGVSGLSAATRGTRLRTALHNVRYGGSTQAVDHVVSEDRARDGRRTGPGLTQIMSVIASTVFLIDLLTRALFGLGWKPFL